MKKRVGHLAGAALASVLLTTACGGNGGGSTGAPPAASGGKVNLTFWSWDPHVDKVVDLWNGSHPNIHVTLSNPAGGDQLVSKMITAHQAKNGPDIAKVEYQSLSSLVSNGVVRDITEYTKAAVANFDPATLSATKFEGKVYGIPQDVAPLMLFYRTDVFQQYGLSGPPTCEQHAQEAATLHPKRRNIAMTTSDPADPACFTG